MIIQTKRYQFILGSIPLLLLIPLVTMQFSREVDWSIMDFVVMGFLLIFLGTGIELTLQKVATKKNRLFLVASIFLLFLLLWAELAVGLFGTPFAGS